MRVLAKKSDRRLAQAETVVTSVAEYVHAHAYTHARIYVHRGMKKISEQATKQTTTTSKRACELKKRTINIVFGVLN